MHTPIPVVESNFSDGFETREPTTRCQPAAEVPCDDGIECTLDPCREDIKACGGLCATRAVRRDLVSTSAGQTSFEVLATVGWVTSESTSGSSSASGVSSGDGLLATMAAEASAEPWLRALGLLEPMP